MVRNSSITMMMEMMMTDEDDDADDEEDHRANNEENVEDDDDDDADPYPFWLKLVPPRLIICICSICPCGQAWLQIIARSAHQLMSRTPAKALGINSNRLKKSWGLPRQMSKRLLRS